MLLRFYSLFGLWLNCFRTHMLRYSSDNFSFMVITMIVMFFWVFIMVVVFFAMILVMPLLFLMSMVVMMMVVATCSMVVFVTVGLLLDIISHFFGLSFLLEHGLRFQSFLLQLDEFVMAY